MPASGKLCLPRALKYWNSRVGSVSCSSMRAPAAAKPDVGGRFAPVCCAAQPVFQARRRSAVLRSTPASGRASETLQATESVIASITAGGKAMQQAPCSFAPKLQFIFRLSIKPKSRLVPFVFGLHRKTRPAVKRNSQQSLLSAPSKVSISVAVEASQCLLAVLANPSLNRTHCGVPPFWLKNPSPNASPPQWAG